MYKSYKVVKTDTPIEINAIWDKPAWNAIEAVKLEYYMGKAPDYIPAVQAKVRWDDNNIYVIFRVEDKCVKAVKRPLQGSVCRDSCVEFFFIPKEETDKGYFNLETNCIGNMLMSHQIERGKNVVSIKTSDLEKIELATSLPKSLPIENEITEPTVWTLEYALPWRILSDYMDIVKPAPGVKWRANFYNCADDTSNPHWLTWSKVPLEKPDFHVPQYFGYLELV